MKVGCNTRLSDGKTFAGDICTQRDPQVLRPIRTPLATAMAGQAGLVIFVLLIFASVAYFAFGGSHPAVSASEAGTSIAAAAVDPADVSGVPRIEKASRSSPGPTDYFPAAYPNRGRDGDGNVMTYEHD